MGSSAQLLSHVRLLTTPWTAACQASLSISNSRSLLIKLMFIKSMMPTGDGEFTAYFNSDRWNLGMLWWQGLWRVCSSLLWERWAIRLVRAPEFRHSKNDQGFSSNPKQAILTFSENLFKESSLESFVAKHISCSFKCKLFWVRGWANRDFTILSEPCLPGQQYTIINRMWVLNRCQCILTFAPILLNAYNNNTEKASLYGPVLYTQRKRLERLGTCPSWHG